MDLLISALLIFVIISGVAGLFFCQNYVRKISCLSISYSGFLFLIITISIYSSEKFNTILTIMVSVLIIFATNLFFGITIAKNIEKTTI